MSYQNNTIEALKKLYVAMGGDEDDVENLNITPEMISAIADIYQGGGGGGSDLPRVTTDDNGKLLTVVEGEWDKADAEKEIVNINYTGTITDIDTMTISWTCDKTYEQINAARTSGKQIQAIATITGVGSLVTPTYAALSAGIAFTAVGSLDSTHAQYISIYHGNADTISSKIVNLTTLS